MCNTPSDKNFMKECKVCFSHTWCWREQCSQEMQMSIWSTTGQLLTTRLNCLIFHYTDSHFSCKSNKRHSYPIIISYISAHMIQTEIENPHNFFLSKHHYRFMLFSFVSCLFFFYSNHSTYSGSLSHTQAHTHTLSLSQPIQCPQDSCFWKGKILTVSCKMWGRAITAIQVHL